MSHDVVSEPYQVLCEGRAEVEFFDHLMRHRGIRHFEVSCPQDKKGQCMGKSGFVHRLRAFQTVSALKGIVVVIDADDNPAGAFEYARLQIGDAGKFPVPTSPFAIEKAQDQPATAVLVMPGQNRKGHLDCLLLDCFGNLCSGLTPHVERYCTETGIDSWNEAEISKAKLRLLIAASYRRNPGIALSFWVKDDNRPFDYNHTAFDWLCGFLNNFSAAIP